MKVIEIFILYFQTIEYWYWFLNVIFWDIWKGDYWYSFNIMENLDTVYQKQWYGILRTTAERLGQ